MKDVSEHELARLAEPLQRICTDAGVAFIVNDSMPLAKRLGADGVHLGQQDGDVREARAVLGRAGIVRSAAYEGFRQAMDGYERAEGLRPPGNVDALLRWNSCVRTIQRERLEPEPESGEQPLE